MQMSRAPWSTKLRSSSVASVLPAPNRTNRTTGIAAIGKACPLAGLRENPSASSWNLYATISLVVGIPTAPMFMRSKRVRSCSGSISRASTTEAATRRSRSVVRIRYRSSSSRLVLLIDHTRSLLAPPGLHSPRTVVPLPWQAFESPCATRYIGRSAASTKAFIVLCGSCLVQ